MNAKQNGSILRWWRIDAVGVLVCAAVTGLCFVTLVQPTIGNRCAYEQLQPQVAQRERDVQNARSTLLSLQSDLDKTRTQLVSLPLRLESASQVNSRMAGLTEMASRAGLDVHQILPDTTREGRRYDIVPIVLSGGGDYVKVTRFMREVHEHFADIAVVGFDLGTQAPGEDAARFNIGLAWYTLPAMGFVGN